MIIWYALIFILTMAGGIGFASIHDFNTLEWVITLGISGFIGSSAVALIFTLVFFFRRETREEKEERIKAGEAKQHQVIKRLPQ